MHKFEIWFAELPFHEGSHVLRGPHPVIIVSNEIAYERSTILTVIPLTSKLKRLAMPTHVLICGQGLIRDSLALCEQIMTVDKSCLTLRIGYISNEFDRYALMHAIAVQLGMVA